MKFGLFLAVLVLLAATNVYGQGKTKGGRRVRPDTTTNEEIHSSEKKHGDHDVVDTKTKDRKDFDTKPEDRKDFGTKTEDRKDFDTKPEDRKDFGTKTEGRKDFDTKTEDRTRDETSVPSDVTGKKVIVTKVETTVPVDGTDGKHVVTKVETSGRPDRFRHDKVEGEGHQAANKLEEDEHEKLPTDKHLDKDEDDKKVDIIHEHKVDLVDSRGPIKSVHVHGTITLVKYPSSVVDSVQYDLDGSLSTIDSLRPFRPVLPFARDYLARGSHVTFYVSTTKTNDPKSAFAKFPIFYKKDNFPLTFELDIDLPEKQRGLLERADITLYFFVYITDSERLIETFVPAGYSQILLQGTNRNIHPLEVYVRANGLEVNGLFRGRFGERFIEPGTVFQVLVVDEKTLGQKLISTTDAIAQLTLSNIPSMFPVPFSFLVHYQMIKPKTKYFAVSYIVEKGVRRLINYEPIWLISEERVLATTQLIFTVVPYPFILKGRVTRSMPGSFVVQPGSSLGLNIRTIGSNEPDIVFRIPEITMLPQYFQINVTESTRFDPSQNYEVTAQITDKNNNIYMISSQPIPILDDIDKIIIPVDDYLYYVQVRLQSSTGQELTYIPGSTAQILLTETPETPSKPLTSMAIKLVEKNFHEFTLTIPTTSVLRNRNYYLVMMIEINGVITHVSKTLLISNSQRPPLLVQLPVLSLNFIRGVISDIDHRQAQWSSSSISKLYLLDDTIPDPEKAIVQSWRIHLENDFPIRFEVQIDFSRLDFSRTYRLQSAIENGRGKIEYRPATSAVAVGSRSGIRNDVRVFVRNVKTSQLVRGIIHIDGVTGPLPEKGELIIQVSTTPSIINPRIVDEFRINVENRTLPVDFHFELSLRKFDLNAVYYFLVRYAVRGSVVIPVSQVFAFAPRNQATLVIRLSRTPQIAISGQVTSTGSALDLPVGTTLHLYVTDNLNEEKPFIYSEVFLQSTSNSLYEFTMLVDSLIVQKKIPLYLRADILYEDRVILRMPRPALMQLTSESTWNINLVIDLPTLIVGEIVSVSSELKVTGEFDAYLYVVESVTKQIVHTVRLRLNGKLPTKFRIELDNSLFLKNPDLKLRAIIKNCREEILYESGGDISIHVGLNLETKLTVTVKDIKKLTEIRPIIDETASFYGGSWKLVVTGVTSTIRTGELITTTTSFRK